MLGMAGTQQWRTPHLTACRSDAYGRLMRRLSIAAAGAFLALASPAAANHAPPTLLSTGTTEAAFMPLGGVSDDGSKVLILTGEALDTVNDTDGGSTDAYVKTSGGYELVTDRVQAGADAALGVSAAISADGTRVTFSTAEPILATDQDSKTDLYQRIGTTTTLLTDGPGPAADAETDAFGFTNRAGTRTLFTTVEPLLPEDGDTRQDVYERTSGGLTLVSDRVQGGADADTPTSIAGPAAGGWSADGSHVYFATSEQIVDADDDSSSDIYQRAGGVTTLLTDRQQDAADEDKNVDSVAFPSADGSHFFFSTDEALVAADGDSNDDVYERTGGSTVLVSDRIKAGADAAANAGLVATIPPSPDGLRVTFITNEELLDQDNDGLSSQTFDTYQRSGGTTTMLSDRVRAGADEAKNAIALRASVDNTKVVIFSFEQLTSDDGDDTQDAFLWSGGAPMLISGRVQPGPGSATVTPGGISQDGSRVFFTTPEQIVAGDTDSSSDLYEWSGGVTSIVGDRGDATQDADVVSSVPHISADGTRVYFSTTQQLSATDTDSVNDVFLANAGPAPPDDGGGDDGGGDDGGGGGTTPDPTPTPAPPGPPPFTPPPPGPGPPAVSPPPPASAFVKLPSARKCRSRRRLKLTPRVPSGVSVSTIRVFINGKRVANRAGSKLKVPIDLRGLPRGRYTVKLEITLADGRKVTDTRRYKTCGKKPTKKRKRRRRG
jgi:hypothetical protein